MTYFAIPDDEFLSLEAEALGELDEVLLGGGVEPLGLSLVGRELTFTVVILALAGGVDAAKWWSR